MKTPPELRTWNKIRGEGHPERITRSLGEKRIGIDVDIETHDRLSQFAKKEACTLRSAVAVLVYEALEHRKGG